MSRRLLIVAYFYPPLAGGGVHRVLAFTRHLAAHGWACTVVCAGEDDYWVRDASLAAAIPPGTEVIRVRGGSALAAWLRLRGGRAGEGRRSGGAFAPLRKLAEWWLLPDSYVGWARRARAVVARRIAAGDVHAVLSSSPPDSAHLAAMGPARKAGLPWVADFRDPWIGLHFRTPPSGWHRARQAAMERDVVGRADLVLAASRTHADRLASRTDVAPAPRRVLHLPNGFEPAPHEDVAADPDHFRLAFTGTLSLMEDVGTLLEAVHDVLAAHPEARRRLRVDLAGPYDTDWEDRAIALGLSGIVRFPGALAHAESRRLQRAADALLLWKPHGEGYGTMVPGKLYEYLDAGRPVVALLPAADEAAALVQRAGGSVTPPGDRAALARTLETMYIRWKTHGRAADARPDWLAEYTRERLAARLADALDGLTGGNP